MAQVPERLNLEQCADLLGIERGELRAHIGSLAQHAAGRDRLGRPFWHLEDVHRWAVQTLPATADRIPVTFWPKAAAPARYLGARAIGTAAAAVGWATQCGDLWLAWDYPSDLRRTFPAALSLFPSAAAIMVIGGDFGLTGPAVWAILPGSPDEPHYETQWRHLSDVLGQPVPYWPFPLRIPERVQAWRPGLAAAVVAARPLLDVGPLLRLAAIVEQGSPAQRVLVNFAQTLQSRASADALQDLKIMYGNTEPRTAVVAATPLEVPEVSADDLDESVRRAGWLDILARRDDLAALCARELIMWDGGSDFPASNPESVASDSAYGHEWAQRLVPALRTAAIELLDPDQSAAEVLVDPETDAPVIREHDGSLHAAIPQRLPAVSPLAELILDNPVWVRTEDGTLYPAPKDHYFGLNWGYPGSGPGALAVLADRLLDDINAVAADTITGAPPGLERLMEHDWPRGTVLTRAQLEKAQRDNP